MERHASRKGQSLVEVLVGIALAAIFIVGAASLIAPALQTNKQVAQIQIKAQLAKELSDNVRAWAAGNWAGVLSLTTGTAQYYLNISTSSFTIVGTGASVEAVVLATTTYKRYFSLSDVYRDTNGNVTSTIVSGGYDPSTKLVTIYVNASTTAKSATSTLVVYLTRNSNNAINQSSWLGGSGQSSPITFIGTSYAAATSVTVSATGSLQLAVPVGGSCSL